jgi:hypothetical protein
MLNSAYCKCSRPRGTKKSNKNKKKKCKIIKKIQKKNVTNKLKNNNKKSVELHKKK